MIMSYSLRCRSLSLGRPAAVSRALISSPDIRARFASTHTKLRGRLTHGHCLSPPGRRHGFISMSDSSRAHVANDNARPLRTRTRVARFKSAVSVMPDSCELLFPAGCAISTRLFISPVYADDVGSSDDKLARAIRQSPPPSHS